MEIKLAAFDMDGTLLTDKKELPPDFAAWVQQHREIKTVIASGRQYYTLRDNLEPLGDDLIFIAENGGLVFEGGALLYSNPMKDEDVLLCIEKIEKIPGLTVIPCGADGAYIKKEASEKAVAEALTYYHHLQPCDDMAGEALKDTLVKIAIFVEDKRAEDAMKYFKDLPDHLAVVLSGDSWIDISNADVNKGTGVRAIQEKYQVTKTQSMAFGDYLNDVGLLASCEESYCMENGHPDLKALAKHIAPSNNAYGVMQVLRRLFQDN